MRTTMSHIAVASVPLAIVKPASHACKAPEQNTIKDKVAVPRGSLHVKWPW